jgi:hypothetical protein
MSIRKVCIFQCWKSIAILLYQLGKGIISSASSTFTPMNQHKDEHYYALEQALVEPITAYWMVAHPAAVNQCTSWPFYPLDGLHFFIRFMIFRGWPFTWFFFLFPGFFPNPYLTYPGLKIQNTTLHFHPTYQLTLCTAYYIHLPPLTNPPTYLPIYPPTYIPSYLFT